MRSVFRRGVTPEETLDAIAEIAYEEFQMKVPKEKIMITLEPHKKYAAAAEASIRKEIVAARGKNTSEEDIEKCLRRNDTYIWRKGEIFYHDILGIRGYEIRIFPLRETMGTTPSSLYYSIETIAHETGHALQFEFEKKIPGQDEFDLKWAYARGKYSDSSRALMDILNDNEVREYHLDIANRYSYLTRIKCTKEDIKNAEDKLKNIDTTDKKQRIETIIPYLYEMKEALSEMTIIYQQEMKMHKEKMKMKKSASYTEIKEGWAQYFSRVVMQNLVAKEIAGYEPNLAGKTPEKTLSNARQNEDYLNNKISVLIDEFDNEMQWRLFRMGFFGNGFWKFMDLSQEEAKQLALNYRYDMLMRIKAEESGGK